MQPLYLGGIPGKNGREQVKWYREGREASEGRGHGQVAS